jgi:curved DNA-binding protein CbpA
MNEDDIEKISYLDLYEILDISKDTYEKKKLKKNYKKLVLCLHPDKNGGESEAFEVVNLAYTVLKDKYLKKTYDKKRKEYLNSKDFSSLKSQNNFTDLKLDIPDNEDDAKQNFKVLEDELNKKHNFNSKDLDVISSSEMSKRLKNLTFSRSSFDENYKNTVQKVHYNKEDFNTAFINSSTREDESSREITAFNSSNFQISNYTNINNFDLYSNNAESTTSYGALNTAFKNNIPINVTNSYNSHNYISNEDIQNYNKKMSDHLNDIRKNN